MDKKYFVNVVNLDAGKVYSLPTLYTDRTEACVAGQNYVRDRQQENYDYVFFRVLIAEDGKVNEPWHFEYGGWIEDEDEDEDDPVCGDCDHDCQFCPTNYKVEEEDDEEPSAESLAELLSVFNAARPNY